MSRVYKSLPNARKRVRKAWCCFFACRITCNAHIAKTLTFLLKKRPQLKSMRGTNILNHAPHPFSAAPLLHLVIRRHFWPESHETRTRRQPFTLRNHSAPTLTIFHHLINESAVRTPFHTPKYKYPKLSIVVPLLWPCQHRRNMLCNLPRSYVLYTHTGPLVSTFLAYFRIKGACSPDNQQSAAMTSPPLALYCCLIPYPYTQQEKRHHMSLMTQPN